SAFLDYRVNPPAGGGRLAATSHHHRPAHRGPGGPKPGYLRKFVQIRSYIVTTSGPQGGTNSGSGAHCGGWYSGDSRISAFMYCSLPFTPFAYAVKFDCIAAFSGSIMKFMSSF